jgi:hypothetical protein
MKKINYFLKKYDILTPVEKDCLNTIESNKYFKTDSVIPESIAKKMGYNYIEIRLTMIDHEDVVCWNKKTDWVIQANMQPTILHFTELNRTSDLTKVYVKNINIFNDNVLMVFSDNIVNKIKTIESIPIGEYDCWGFPK